MTTAYVNEPQMSDEAIQKGSGKSWAEWIELLDAWDAPERSHKEIADYIYGLGVSGWWAQAVTVGYERIKGLRELGQVGDGVYQGSASKTFPVPVERLYAAWTDEAERDAWLPAGTLALRGAQGDRSARFDLGDGSGILALWFTDKGPGKSSVQLQNEKLPSKEATVTFRDTWKAHFAELAAYLKGK